MKPAPKPGRGQSEMDYFRDAYGVPAGIGEPVAYDAQTGVIAGADRSLLIVQLDSGGSLSVHPLDDRLLWRRVPAVNIVRSVKTAVPLSDGETWLLELSCNHLVRDWKQHHRASSRSGPKRVVCPKCSKPERLLPPPVL